MNRKIALSALAASVILMIGCNLTYVERRPAVVHRRARPVVVHHPAPVVVHEHHHGRPVVVEHVHSRDCGCVHDGHSYFVIDKGHRHGPGCGHQFNGRHWVVYKEQPARVRRVR